MIQIGFKNTGNFGDFEVIEYINCNKVKVLFNDGYSRYASAKEVKKGVVKNPYFPNVHGIAFIGEGNYCAKIGNKNTHVYDVWNSMIKRCYNNNNHNKRPTYQNVTVCKEWHNFQNFAKWYNSHKFFDKNYHLDKDLTFIGCKVYSPETCDLVPHEVNTLLLDSGSIRGKYSLGVHFCSSKKKFVSQCNMGELTKTGNKKQTYLGAFLTEKEAFAAYKQAKEFRIKQVANKYRSEISEQIYNNLINYEVLP